MWYCRSCCFISSFDKSGIIKTAGYLNTDYRNNCNIDVVWA